MIARLRLVQSAADLAAARRAAEGADEALDAAIAGTGEGADEVVRQWPLCDVRGPR